MMYIKRYLNRQRILRNIQSNIRDDKYGLGKKNKKISEARCIFKMKYTVKQHGRSLELSEANSSILVYRIPYQDLVNGVDPSLKIKNKFIVYILFGESESGKDVVYVGKSKNGIKNRPTSHENLYDHWEYCYILTQFEERTFFNDGTIQYIEDQVNKKVNDINHYDNKTTQTNGGTANRNDEEDCDTYLQKAYLMLDVLGLDLITYMQDDTDENTSPEEDTTSVIIVPDGSYHMSRKLKKWNNKTAKGYMTVANGKYILLKGSDVCPNEGKGLIDSVRIKRNTANIINDILQDDLVFASPSGAAEFVLGCSANGWTTWKTEVDEPISIFRERA